MPVHPQPKTLLSGLFQVQLLHRIATQPILALIAVLAAPVAPNKAHADDLPRQPNIVIILADDMD